MRAKQRISRSYTFQYKVYHPVFTRITHKIQAGRTLSETKKA